jgi:DNA replication protein DnaC
MENMNESVSISSRDDIMRKWTAAELGVKPIRCPICGQEKTWRKGVIMGALIRVPIMCQCEVDLEEEIKRKEEAKAKQERINRILALSNLGERFKDASFDTFQTTPATANCLDSFSNYAENFSKDTEEGICIYGRAGNGKSHLAAALVNRVIQRGFTAVFIEVPDLFSRIKATYGADGEASEDKIMRSLASCDLLVLDDAGAEKPSVWVQEKFYQIINARYKNRKPLVVTTNTPDMAGLEEILGFRAYDRVLEMCTPLKNNGESYRRSIAVQRLRKG